MQILCEQDLPSPSERIEHPEGWARRQLQLYYDQANGEARPGSAALSTELTPSLYWCPVPSGLPEPLF